MRAREVRELLKGKVAPDVSRVIEAVAEDQHVVQQSIVALAEMFDKMQDVLQDMSNVQNNMKSAVDKVRKMNPEVNSDGTTD